jgi:hypothetical protein
MLSAYPQVAIIFTKESHPETAREKGHSQLLLSAYCGVDQVRPSLFEIEYAILK